MPVLAHCDMETEGELVMLFYARAYTDYGKQFSGVSFSVNSVKGLEWEISINF